MLSTSLHTERSRTLRKNMTLAESRLWKHLRQRQVLGLKARRQWVIGPYIVDFAYPSKKLIIECDGGQHANQCEYDSMRTQFLENRGYRVVRFWNNEVLENMEVVLEVIVALLE